MTLLEVRGVEVVDPSSVPPRRVLGDVSLRVEAEQRLGITGPSGAGKSTLAFALCGLLPVPLRWRKGEIDIRGVRMAPGDSRAWAAVRGRDIFLLFQSAATALHPHLTVGRQLTEALEEVRGMSRTESRREAQRRLEEVGLPSFAFSAYPYQLSGGMRQRVQIALALGLGCRLLIADEPTAGLDPVVRAEILSLLCRAADDLRAGLLLISHDLRLLRGTVDTLAVLDEGHLVEVGPPGRLFSAPLAPQSRRLVEALHVLERQADVGISP
ncbi:MAG: ABC transporter ATP-binding protein [Desulfobacterales bacterium]